MWVTISHTAKTIMTSRGVRRENSFPPSSISIHWVKHRAKVNIEPKKICCNERKFKDPCKRDKTATWFWSVNYYRILETMHKNDVFHYWFLQQMWPNPLFPVDLVRFTEEILNEKFNFLCRESSELRGRDLENTAQWVNAL